MTINELVRECHRTAVDHGFWVDSPNVGEKIALMHSELSEALEGARHNNYDNVAEEMADVCIRVFDFCGHYYIDLEDALEKKMAINKERSYKHGKQF